MVARDGGRFTYVGNNIRSPPQSLGVNVRIVLTDGFGIVSDEFLNNRRGDAGALHEAGEGVAEGVERQFGNLPRSGPARFGFGVRSLWGETGVGHDFLELIGEGADAQAALDASVRGRKHLSVFLRLLILGLLEPLEEWRRDREDLAPAGFLSGEGEGGRFEVDGFPLERRDVAEPLTGVEAGEDEAAPFALGDRQELAELVHGEGTPFALAVRLAERFDLGGRVLLDQAVPPGLLESDSDDFELFVDRTGRHSGAQFIPEMGDVGGGDKREILVRTITQ